MHTAALSLVAVFASLAAAIDVLVPLYVYPSAGAWNPLFTAASQNPDVTFYAVINPDSGPGGATYPNSDYVTGISTLNSHDNIVTVGYVHTNYAADPYATVKANITKYFGWSNYNGADISVDGIFFDEAPSAANSADYTYMSNGASYAHTQVDTVIFNTGVVNTAAQYFQYADIILDFENYYSAYNPSSTPQSIPAAERAKSAIVLHNTPSASNVAGVVNSAAANNIKAVYLTDDCCYNDLNLLSTVAAAAQAAS